MIKQIKNKFSLYNIKKNYNFLMFTKLGRLLLVIIIVAISAVLNNMLEDPITYVVLCCGTFIICSYAVIYSVYGLIINPYKNQKLNKNKNINNEQF